LTKWLIHMVAAVGVCGQCVVAVWSLCGRVRLVCGWCVLDHVHCMGRASVGVHHLQPHRVPTCSQDTVRACVHWCDCEQHCVVVWCGCACMGMAVYGCAPYATHTATPVCASTFIDTYPKPGHLGRVCVGGWVGGWVGERVCVGGGGGGSVRGCLCTSMFHGQGNCGESTGLAYMFVP
jgi:hypothetical protein